MFFFPIMKLFILISPNGAEGAGSLPRNALWGPEQQVEAFKPLGGALPANIREIAKFQLFDSPAQFQEAIMDASGGIAQLPGWAEDLPGAAEDCRAGDQEKARPATPLGMVLGEKRAEGALRFDEMLAERRFAAGVIQRVRDSVPGCSQGICREPNEM